MSPPVTPLPSLPPDTAREARTAYHREHLYLLIGDRLDLLCADISWQGLSALSDSDARSLFLMTMLTLFQFAEDIPDHQAADAVRTRLDWKYALHLPLDYPGLDPARLADFRQRAARQEAGQRALSCLLARLESVGLLGRPRKRGADAQRALWVVEMLNRVERAQEAMSMVVEGLAANEGEWLRHISPPHWLARYSRWSSEERLWTEGNLPAQLKAVGSDMAHLLSAVEVSGRPELAGWPEVQTLRQAWRQTQEALASAETYRQGWAT